MFKQSADMPRYKTHESVAELPEFSLFVDAVRHDKTVKVFAAGHGMSSSIYLTRDDAKALAAELLLAVESLAPVVVPVAEEVAA